MNPETPIKQSGEVKQAKFLRYIITGGLLLVLFAIVFAYIYFGMQLAKQADPVPVVDSEPTISEDDRTRAILQALENAPTEPTANVEEMLEALENAPTEPTANREEMLRALNYPGVE